MDDRNFRPVVNRTQIASRQAIMFSMVLLASIFIAETSVLADQPQWIWSPKNTGVSDGSSQGECFFRKKFTLIRPAKAEMELAAGDEYEIYINGLLAIRGQSFGTSTKMDVANLLHPGVNLISAKVRHHDGNQVGLAMRIRVQEKGETRWRSLTTDDSWKTRVQEMESWKSTVYDDIGWLKAQTLGEFVDPETASDAIVGQFQPAVRKQLASTAASAEQAAISEQIAANAPVNPAPVAQSNPTSSTPATAGSSPEGRFEINSEFTVQRVLAGSETGSLIAMEFNEFGKLLLSREGGPLLLADPTKELNDPARVRVYCDQVSSCQGILPLNGNVYVTASGPKGLGVYKLADTNRDGMLEVQETLASFTGEPGEHGPHGLQLGPDGMLYVIVGNGSQVEGITDLTSPYQHYYEGDLIPRYEDPGGHAKGVKAPGGTVVRMSLDGSKTEIVAGGIRNAYDLVFDSQGELFIHDSDMESDIGTTWYRPTMVFHVPAGAEFGWRSGWAKFPQYFADQTPAVCETGRGSPAGAVLYQHLQFPSRYHDTMFLADWSEGRILALRTQPDGAGYKVEPETFLKGRPLNVVDLAIGEDGGMYFCTGGRGTEGGVYRITWKGKVPDKVLNFESDLAKVIRHPQPNSAWARQNIAQLKIAMGDNWNPAIEGVATEKRNTNKMRLRAMQLMVLYGPAPGKEFLATQVKDDSPEIRAQIARLCGLKPGNESETVLRELITDASPLVRRIACESFMRLDVQPELSAILPMLSSNDRIESLSARRLIERIPAEQWESEVFTTEDKRLFIQGSIALMTADPTLERAYKILAQGSKFMEGFVNDSDFVDMLRAMELALVRGEVDPSRVPGLVVRLGNEFPSGSSTINRELVRMLAFLKAGDLQGRIESYLQDEEVSIQDKVHLGMHMQSVGSDLTPTARMAIIDALEKARNVEGAGGSYALYLQRAVEDVSKTITAEQVKSVLRSGHRWPNAVVAAFYKLPEKLDQETVDLVIQMDQAIHKENKQDVASKKMRLGVIAILARSGDATSMDYLRQLWQDEEARRNDIVIGLSQQPEGENWAYLVSSLPVLDDLTGVEVIEKLTVIARRPRDARHFRDLIALGYRLRGQDDDATLLLLEHWSGKQLVQTESDWKSKMDTWRTWFAQNWPGEPGIDADAEVATTSGKHSVDQLLADLSNIGPGNPANGHAAFVKAQCATCHHFDGQGQSVGPELTSLAQRFSMRETIESTIDPSKVIPDRYASKTILTTDGIQFSGMTIEQSDGSYFVLQSDGKRIRVAADDVEGISDSQKSAMPEGLLDDLSVSEINDLFAYLLKPTGETASMGNSVPSVSQVEVGPVR